MLVQLQPCPPPLIGLHRYGSETLSGHGRVRGKHIPKPMSNGGRITLVGAVIAALLGLAQLTVGLEDSWLEARALFGHYPRPIILQALPEISQRRGELDLLITIHNPSHEEVIITGLRYGPALTVQTSGVEPAYDKTGGDSYGVLTPKGDYRLEDVCWHLGNEAFPQPFMVAPKKTGVMRLRFEKPGSTDGDCVMLVQLRSNHGESEKSRGIDLRKATFNKSAR